MDLNDFFLEDEKKEEILEKKDEEKKIKYYGESLGTKEARKSFEEYLEKNYSYLDPKLIKSLKKCFLSNQLKSFSVKPLKRIFYVEELNEKDKSVYLNLIQDLKTDQALLELKTKIESQTISGRLIEETLIKYPNHYDPVYHLDFSLDKNDPVYVSDKSDKLGNFNFKNSYSSVSKHFDKDYFDPFGRGVQVFHFLKEQNQWIHISLCRYLFYKWAFKYKFVDFVKDKIDVVLNIKKLEKKIKKPKITSK